jgi:hypothetical protein
MKDEKAMKHTPGPWRYERWGQSEKHVTHAFVWGPSVIVHCPGGNLDKTEPDMRLIAAAPELLDAGRRMVEDYQTSEQHHPNHILVPLIAFEAMQVAIAKAEGH